MKITQWETSFDLDTSHLAVPLAKYRAGPVKVHQKRISFSSAFYFWRLITNKTFVMAKLTTNVDAAREAFYIKSCSIVSPTFSTWDHISDSCNWESTFASLAHGNGPYHSNAKGRFYRFLSSYRTNTANDDYILQLWNLQSSVQCRLTDWLTDRLTDWPTDRLTDWPTDRLN